MANAVDDLEAEIHRLDDLGLNELRKLCGLILGAVVMNHGVHLLRRRLAYALQSKALGDLPEATKRRLHRLQHSFEADPQHNPLTKHAVKAGTVLTRNWRGVLHQVHVTERGYDYRGEQYSSLSEVARRITGTRWSGPLFFGLKARS